MSKEIYYVENIDTFTGDNFPINFGFLQNSGEVFFAFITMDLQQTNILVDTADLIINGGWDEERYAALSTSDWVNYFYIMPFELDEGGMISFVSVV